jgi:hypothetical protein
MTTDPSPPPPTTAAPDAPRPRAGFPVVPLVLAVLAAAATWPVVETYREYFQASDKAKAEAYNFVPLNRETKEANGKNGAICFGALGALLGLALGVSGGLGRRSGGSALTAGLVGALLGLAAGALPSFIAMPLAHEHKDDMLSQPAIGLGIHLGLWVPLGAAAGLAYALGRFGGSPRHLILGFVGGLIGAALGTIAYEVVGAVFLSMHATQYPFASDIEPPDTSHFTRLFSLLCVAIGATLGAVAATNSVPRRPDAVAAPVSAGTATA